LLSLGVAGSAGAEAPVAGRPTPHLSLRVAGSAEGYVGTAAKYLPLGFGFMVAGELELTPFTALELGFHQGRNPYSDNRASFDDGTAWTVRNGVQGSLRVSLVPEAARVRPYVLAGFSHHWVTDSANDLSASPAYRDESAIPLGAGVRAGFGRFYVDGRFTYDLVLNPLTMEGDKGHRYRPELGVGVRF
jgi:hypothetical protein